ncbi:MAG TPA: hypothetical protein VIL86_16400, partial [Tepidisphaeraceae bacterium]
MPPLKRLNHFFVIMLIAAPPWAPGFARGAGGAEPARDITLEQIVLREHPDFHPDKARLSVGRDGLVYLCNTAIGDSFILRLQADGTQKVGIPTESAAHNATANADGIIATSNAHFGRKVALFKPSGQKIGEIGDMRGGDDVGWDAPAHVEAGTSGNFYVLDQHRDRIVCLSAVPNVLKAYELPPTPPKTQPFQDFRVDEKRQCFYLATTSYGVRCVGFDGKLKWTAAVSVSANTYEGCNGGFDVGEDGTLYAIESLAEKVRRFDADGKEQEALALKMGGGKPVAAHPIKDLRIAGTDLLIKRLHPTELFQRFDRATGALKQVAQADHEKLTATFPSDAWQAGAEIPFKLDFLTGGRSIEPHWRVWASPFGTSDYRELKVENGALRMPAELAGIYAVKISPEVDPREGGIASEYLLKTVVEVRAPGAVGTAAILLGDNRTYYARGESIPFSALLRAGGRKDAASITVRLKQKDVVLAQAESRVDATAAAVEFTLSPALTATLAPGAYRLDISAEGYTCVGQSIVIGPGAREPGFHVMVYGDYGGTYPSGTNIDLWNTSDQIAAHVERTRKLGFNMMVDRLGAQPAAFEWWNGAMAPVKSFTDKLTADAAAAPPQMLSSPSPLKQTLASYSSQGIQEMAILMMNDASLPPPGPYDSRKPEQLVEIINRVTTAAQVYPSFRGWSWASNWWVTARGAAAAQSPEERAQYEAAMKKANETGAWDPVLEKVGDYQLSHAPTAQELFNTTLKKIAPRLITASAAPFRNVQAYPPVTLGNVDEADLQAQWEQIAIPLHAPFGVDFYKRPGKRAWGHPEIWNDDGTGGQIGTTLFQMFMRGTDGIGTSGPVPNWTRAQTNADDPRVGYGGIVSVFRAVNNLMRQYGPWMTSLQKADRVALIASPRMFKTDEWHANTGLHFARVFEAYISCLHAHLPASVVFVEDLQPQTLGQFKAILLVDQRIEMEPALVEAIKAAQKAGAGVFADGTCRPELVKDFTPLGISFNRVENDPNSAGDDAAYWRFRDYARATCGKLAEVLKPSVTPAAEIDNDEVYVSERTGEAGRYFFLVNNSTPDLDPGHLWRMNLVVTSRIPVVAKMKIAGDAKHIYDVFARKEVQPPDGGAGGISVDLRDLPGRVFAVLPAAIDHIALVGPGGAKAQGGPQAGALCHWQAIVQDAADAPVHAIIPIRVRLLDASRQVIEENFTNSPSAGASGQFTLPLT